MCIRACILFLKIVPTAKVEQLQNSGIQPAQVQTQQKEVEDVKVETAESSDESDEEENEVCRELKVWKKKVIYN